jgi:hypothetical protein
LVRHREKTRYKESIDEVSLLDQSGLGRNQCGGTNKRANIEGDGGRRPLSWGMEAEWNALAALSHSREREGKNNIVKRGGQGCFKVDWKV